MNPELWQRAEQALRQVLDEDPERRERAMHEACAGDEALLIEVKSLLRHEDASQDFLTSPALGESFHVAGAVAPEDATLQSGERVGQYRIERLVGVGGMGEVYAAKRDADDFEQRVAIKLVKRGMDSRDILRRFRLERQALASLDHPYIAGLIDAGAAEDGRPFLVMQYVDGLPIDQFCEKHDLSIPDRLRLFVRVCETVQFAHQNLVVHRDLKPSNLLITGEGQPKLLDFGIAKLLQPTGDSPSKTQTLATSRILTPQFASPEQVRAERIGTASDIYSLGVILYCLLTGMPPYSLKTRSPAEIERAICETDPKRPSTAVASRSDRISSRLARRVRGDLDNIVMRAMHKDPNRRYESAQQLAADIVRHIENQPVLARPDSLRYRTGKFISRNRLLVGATATIAISLVGATIATTAFMFEADDQRALAVDRLGKLRAAKSETDAALELAEQRQAEAEFRAYVATIGASLAGLKSNNSPAVRRALAEAPEHLRNWEWRYLQSQVEQSRWSSEAGAMVTKIAHRPDGSQFATSTFDGRIALWDAQTGELLDEFTDGAVMRTSASFSPDGALMAMTEAISDPNVGGVTVCNADTHEALWTSRTHDGRAVDIQFSHDGRWVATSGYDNRVRIWDASGGELLKEFALPSWCFDFAFSPDDLQLAVVDRNNVLTVWDIESQESLAILPVHEPDQRLAGTPHAIPVSFSPDGELILAGRHDGPIKVWDAETFEYRGSLLGHSARVTDIAFSSDGSRIVSGSFDSTIRIWDRHELLQITTLNGHDHTVERVCFTNDDKHIISADRSGSIRCWPAGLSDDLTRTTGHAGIGISAIAFSPDESLVASGSVVGDIEIREADSGALVARLLGHRGRVWDLQFTGDGKLISGSADRTARVWNLDHFQPVRVLEHAGFVEDLSISPDGTTLAVAAHSALDLWDLGSYQRIGSVRPIEGSVTRAAFSSDGNTVAMATWQSEHVSLVRVHDGEVLARHQLPNALRELEFSPDGATVVGACTDGSLLLWNRDLEPVATLQAHEGWAASIDFSPDGSRLFSVGSDRVFRVWDFARLTQVLAFEADAEWLHDVECASDGSRVIVASRSVLTHEAEQPTPDLLALRRDRVDAEALIREIRPRVRFMPEVSDEIEAMESINARVRAMALRAAEALGDDAPGRASAGWALVRHADVTEPDRRRATRWINQALQAEPQNPTFLRTLGVALFRENRFQDAIDALDRSDALLIRSRATRHPIARIYAALSLYKLDSEACFDAEIERVEQLLRIPGYASNPAVQEALKELAESTADVSLGDRSSPMSALRSGG